MTLSPRLAARLDHLNYYELPMVSGQILPTETVGPEYHEIMLAELRTQAEEGSPEALWAIEMILRLYEEWVAATDTLSDIQEALDKRQS